MLLSQVPGRPLVFLGSSFTVSEVVEEQEWPTSDSREPSHRANGSRQKRKTKKTTTAEAYQAHTVLLFSLNLSLRVCAFAVDDSKRNFCIECHISCLVRLAQQQHLFDPGPNWTELDQHHQYVSN